MQFQKLVFVTNNKEFLERKTFWKQLRLAFYEIRDFYSAESNDAQVSFALLSNDNSENRLLKSTNLETFSVS